MTDPPYIPFHVPSVGVEEVEETAATIRAGLLASGKKTAQFEDEFCRAVGSLHAIAVNSPAAGLHLALIASGIGAGDEVITTPMTFCSTVNAIIHAGAKPVLADIGKDGNIDPGCIIQRLTRRTRAIIPVHLAGASCDMDAIWDIARRRNLKVIEDATQACGSGYRDRLVGSSYGHAPSDAVVFSISPAAEGGVVVTASEALANHIRRLALNGISQKGDPGYSDSLHWYYDVLESGYDYKLADIQSCIGIHQLRKLATFQLKRNAMATFYNQQFKDVTEIELPPPSVHGTHAWSLYVIRLRLERLQIDREGFLQQLRARKVGAAVHFTPIQNCRFFAPFANDNVCPRAAELYWRVVSLPIYPQLPEGDMARVVSEVKRIIDGNRTTARAYLEGQAAS